MPTIELLAHISTDGRVTVPPIPDWPGGEANMPVYVRLPVTEKERKAAEDFMTSWDGCLKGVPHMTAKEIRAERLEKKYGSGRSLNDERQTDPARILSNGKTALDDFLDYCKELNLPPLTDEEVDQAKTDYLMEKYG